MLRTLHSWEDLPKWICLRARAPHHNGASACTSDVQQPVCSYLDCVRVGLCISSQVSPPLNIYVLTVGVVLVVVGCLLHHMTCAAGDHLVWIHCQSVGGP